MSIEPIAQIILSVAVSIVVILILIIIVFRGVRVHSDKISVDIDGKKRKKDSSGSKEKDKEKLYYIFSAEDMESIIDILSSFLEHLYEVSDVVSMQKKMDIVENRLSLLYDHKITFFSEKLMEKGIPANNVSNHVDYLHYRQLVDRILYFDDGTSNSVKALLRKYLRDKNYSIDPALSEVENRNRFDKLVSNVIDETIQKTKRIWYDNYHSSVIDFDGITNKQRVVSVEEIIEFESSEKIIELKKNIISEIFEHALEIDCWVSKEKEGIKDDRKKQIQMFLLKRKGD